MCRVDEHFPPSSFLPPAKQQKRTDCFQYYSTKRGIRSSPFVTGRDQAESLCFLQLILWSLYCRTPKLWESIDAFRAHPNKTASGKKRWLIPCAEKETEAEFNYLFSSGHVGGPSKHPACPNIWEAPKADRGINQSVIVKATERMTLEKPFGFYVRWGGHHFFCLFEEIFKNQIMLGLYKTNQISWTP